jgi:hypothetical protein
MTEKLIVFTFTGILGILLYQLGIGVISARYFSTTALFVVYWYVPHIVMPIVLLLGFAWWLGFFHKRSSRWADTGSVLVTALIIFCTIGAPYNCLHQFCF